METIVERIRVRLRPPSGSGRLRPRYDDEADVLEVSSAAPRDWPFGVDIDGRIIFDLDRNRVLANFDLLIARRLWKVSPTIAPPASTKRADLEFTTETLAEKSFSLPLKVSTDRERTSVLIAFGGEATPAADVVELSDQCFAFVEGGALLGFFISLAPDGNSSPTK